MDRENIVYFIIDRPFVFRVKLVYGDHDDISDYCQHKHNYVLYRCITCKNEESAAATLRMFTSLLSDKIISYGWYSLSLGALKSMCNLVDEMINVVMVDVPGVALYNTAHAVNYGGGPLHLSDARCDYCKNIYAVGATASYKTIKE
jgi:hypothetical protein